MWQIDGAAKVEIDNSSDRVAAIVGGSYVQAALLNGLKNYLVNDAAVFKRMFEHSGPLASFEAQIRTAYLCSFISKDFHNDLLILKHVRNQFAHRNEVDSFEEQSIKDKLQNLKYLNIGIMAYGIVKKEQAPPRERYISACGEAAPQLNQRRYAGLLPDPIGAPPDGPSPSRGKSR